MSRPRIVVAMSGGVDSSAAAGLLHEAGCEVVGVTLRLYDAAGTKASIGGRCCGPRDIEDARATAATLGFAHYVLDHSEAFKEAVINDFVAEHRAGRTPNPCVRCNQHLKFGPLVRFARAMGAQGLATGHYARICTEAGKIRLERAVDRDKDQAYFLFAVQPEHLALVQFPLGGMTKAQVRAAALRLGLPNCDKPESQEICFIPDGDHKAFVAARGGAGRPGEILAEDGRSLGRHAGTHQFTIGQRRGLPAEGGKPRRFVLRVEPETGNVITGPREHLMRSSMRVADAKWLLQPTNTPRRCHVQFRHHAAAHPAEIRVVGPDLATVEVDFAEPVEAGAPGQAAVFYDGDVVLGGGWIEAG